MTLFLSGTLLDSITERMYQLLTHPDAGLVFVFVTGIFILFSSFTVLNMLIGVLCEVVSETAAREGEASLVSQIREQIIDVYNDIDEDGTGGVSKLEFEQMRTHPTVLEALAKVDV